MLCHPDENISAPLGTTQLEIIIALLDAIPYSHYDVESAAAFLAECEPRTSKLFNILIKFSLPRGRLLPKIQLPKFGGELNLCMRNL